MLKELKDTVLCDRTRKNRVLMIATSDFQEVSTSYLNYDYAGNGNFEPQVRLMQKVMSKIREEYGDAYQFIGGGDYGFDETKETPEVTKRGMDIINRAVTDMLGQVPVISIQGNHDAPDYATPSGPHDTEYYGVFTMNENEYRSYPKIPRKWEDWEESETYALKLSAQLDAYLSERLSVHPDQPVFVCSHVPLHFSSRTVHNGDAMFARPFFDLITKYAEYLNIIFLYGHNHAHGDDDFMGGASVFLTRGDSLKIAKYGSQSECTDEVLNFTYMNFGYIGYYWDEWGHSYETIVHSEPDNTLTMTAFVIEGSRVTVSRFDENGMHVLKAAGHVSKSRHTDPSIWPPDTKVYESPMTVDRPGKETDD